LDIAHELGECGAVHKGKRLAHLEGLGVVRETTGRDQNATVGALGGDDSVEFTDLLYPDLTLAPLLALDQDGLAVAAKDKVDATVCTAASRLFHVVTLAAERFAYELLELTPRQGSDGVRPGLAIESHPLDEALNSRDGRCHEGDDGEAVEEEPEQGAQCRVERVTCGTACDNDADDPEHRCGGHTDPPRELPEHVENVFDQACSGHGHSFDAGDSWLFSS